MSTNFNVSEDKDLALIPKWTIRKISFVGILIAISVVFLFVVVGFLPIAILPTYKISFIGLPIKISGFIFGPIVGGFVGLLSDLISFMFLPSWYNPLYTLAAVVDGVVSGIIGWIFMKLLKYYFGGRYRDNYYEYKIKLLMDKLNKIKLQNPNSKKVIKLENKIIYLHEQRKAIRVTNTSQNRLLNVNLLIATLIIVAICLLVSWVVYFQISDDIINRGVIKNRIGLLALMLSGYATMFIFLWIARFRMRPKRYLIIVPIVVFSAFIELINVPVLALADSLTTSNKNDIFVFIFNHCLMSPIKIWGNMFIIYFTYSIMAPLINKNDSICY